MPEVVATTFESFETLVAWLNSMGVDTSSLPSTITTSQELIAYIEAQGWQPVYTVGQYLSGFVKVTGADPSNTTDIVSRVVTDLVPVAGGAAGSLTSGKRTFGMISKRIAAGAIIAALGVCTFASQIGEYINNLVEGLTPFTLDGENMAVLLDQNGNAYLDARAIQKFRSDLAELGIFEKGFWYDGTWKKGIFRGLVWKNGVWEDGVWEDGSWYDGTWKKGIWKKGRRKSGSGITWDVRMFSDGPDVSLNGSPTVSPVTVAL